MEDPIFMEFADADFDGAAEDQEFFYDALTRGIRVRVRPIYLDDQSEPSEDHYVWAYEVEIENEGSETVQLTDRYWRITDAFGRVQEVRGDRPQLGVLAITHYQRLLTELTPDRVHVIVDGRIVASGGLEIAEQLEQEGYEPFGATA